MSTVETFLLDTVYIYISDFFLPARLPNISANFLAIENRYQYARCVQPSYHKDRPTIAVGLGDGKIGICHFHDVVDNSLEYSKL